MATAPTFVGDFSALPYNRAGWTGVTVSLEAEGYIYIIPPSWAEWVVVTCLIPQRAVAIIPAALNLPDAPSVILNGGTAVSAYTPRAILWPHGVSMGIINTDPTNGQSVALEFHREGSTCRL